MIIRLKHQRSDGDMDTYHLKSGRRYHIGRGSGCEVRILDLKLSRKHCAVEYTEGEWRVIDLASTNGCKVDGDQIVGSQPLKTGTAIEIGQSTIKVSRILGDDEDGDDEDDRSNEHAAAGEHTDTSKVEPQEMPPVEQLPGDDPDEVDAVKQPAVSDHSANDWEPEPEAELATKTGALTPNARADLKADKALDAARKAAVRAVEDAGSQTGQVQKSSPAFAPTPRPTAAPSASNVASPATKPPVPRHSTPLPMPAADLESGPYKSLDKNPGPGSLELDFGHAQDDSKPAPAKPAPRAESKAPGTETRRRQQIMPIIVQPMSDDEVAAVPPAPSLPIQPQIQQQMPAPAKPAPVPAPSAPMREVNLELTAATLPLRPAAPIPTPAPTPAPAAPGAAGAPDDRTFFITVLGRRVGPLTRAVARDLKARELKGTLTLKDLDQFK